MAWITPTGEVLNGWSGHGLAWDDDTGTSSSYDAAPATWTPYLELTHAALNCDKIQIWINTEKDSMTSVEVDVFYSGSYHNIYRGAPTLGSFAEYTIGSTESVTAIRIKCLNSHAVQARFQYVHEADFNEVVASGATVYPNLLVEDIVPYTTTETAGAKKVVSLLVASMAALSITATVGATTTVSLLNQNIVFYAVTTKTSAILQVSLLVQKVVPYAPIPRANNQIITNLIAQNIVSYTATPKVNTSTQVNLLAQDIVPYSVTIKTSVVQSVSLLVQDIVSYIPIPRADNQITTNLIIQNVVPYATTVKTSAVISVSLLDANVVPYVPTIITSAIQSVPRLVQKTVPYTASGSTGEDYVTDQLVAYWKFDEDGGIYAYDTKGNNTGELKGGIDWDTGYVNSCCLYNGTDSYIEVQDDPSLDVSGDISLEFWLYPDSSMLLGTQRILSKRFDNDIAYEIMAWSDYYAIVIGLSTYVTLPLKIEPDEWAHIIITHGPSDSNYAKIYKNGNYIGQTLADEAITPNDTSLYIGKIGHSTAGQYWKGKIDEVRIYKKILSPAEVWQNYYVTDPPIANANLLIQDIILNSPTAILSVEVSVAKLIQSIVPYPVTTKYGKILSLLIQKIVALHPGYSFEETGLRDCIFTFMNSKSLFQTKTRARNMYSTKVSAKKFINVKTDSHKEDIYDR